MILDFSVNYSFKYRQKEEDQTFSQIGASPFEVHRGDVEHHSFEPQDHEEPLRERAVPDAFSITPRLKQTHTAS